MPRPGKRQNHTTRVVKVTWKGHLKRVVVKSGQVLTVPLSACVGEGDRIRISNANATVVCRNGESQFVQPYLEYDNLKLGGLTVSVAIKEITEVSEFDAYTSLADFHYRGHAIHGRTARLIVRTFHPAYPQVIGYVELATPFYMNKARSRVLNAPFRFGQIHWRQWDTPTLRRYIHVVVRIARTVVYPEFRGLGVGQLLVRHAIEFAKTRWQIAGYLPLFLEISADMLKYVPFAAGAGMKFVGETEGNLHRVAKDMEYLLRRFGTHKNGQTQFEETCGICDQQVARKDRVLKLMSANRLTQEEVIARLKDLSNETVLKEFAFFHDVVSLPKPHYMVGLNAAATNFLESRVQQLGPQNGRLPPHIEVPVMRGAIELRDVSISYISKVRRTRSTHVVQQAFGISPDDLRSDVIRQLSVTIHPGTIVLIVGPSGSGKTSLLRAIGGDRAAGMITAGEIEVPTDADLGAFAEPRSKKPLIELLGTKDFQFALYLLSLAGLSEAFLYLKRFTELSAGQKYRAMLACLIAAGKNVWLADEFCANLDPITASVVSHNIQSLVRKFGATLIAAAPHSSNFIFSLRPDVVIHLSSAWEHEIVEGKNFCKAMSKPYWNGEAPTLRMFPEFIEQVRKGKKTSTIRPGVKALNPGLLILSSDRDSTTVRIVEITVKKLSELTHDDARREGMRSVRVLRESLRSIYPKLRPNSTVTVIRFDSLSDVSSKSG